MSRGENRLTNGLLDKVDGADSETLHHIFCAVTKTALVTPLPRELQHKPRCSRAFNLRADQAGKRLATLGHHLRSDGRVDWASFGPYILEWGENGRLVGVTHIEGDEIKPLPEHVVVTTDFSLRFPWRDFEASSVLDACSHSLAALFKSGAGPNMEKPGRAGSLLDEVTAKVTRRMEQEQAALSAGVVLDADAEFLQTHDRQMIERRKQNLDAARSKLSAAAERRQSMALKTTCAGDRAERALRRVPIGPKAGGGGGVRCDIPQTRWQSMRRRDIGMSKPMARVYSCVMFLLSHQTPPSVDRKAHQELNSEISLQLCAR